MLDGERAPPGGGRKADAPAIPPQAKYKAREAALKAQSERKPGGDREERGKLPESPKRAEEIWQQSVIGDYLARFKVAGGPKGVVPQPAHAGRLQPQVTPPIADTPVCLQNDRVKALKAMEMTWNNMEKKEKLMWIKKAAEDQKRYEVGRRALLACSVGSGEPAASLRFSGRSTLSSVGGPWSQEPQPWLCDPEQTSHLPAQNLSHMSVDGGGGTCPVSVVVIALGMGGACPRCELPGSASVSKALMAWGGRQKYFRVGECSERDPAGCPRRES